MFSLNVHSLRLNLHYYVVLSHILVAWRKGVVNSVAVIDVLLQIYQYSLLYYVAVEIT